MWQFLANLIGGPIVTGLISAYKAKLAAGNTAESIAAGLASRELAVQQREIEVDSALRIAQIGKWYEPEHVAEYVAVAFLAKCVVWDTMLGLGTTPALRGDVLTWVGLIYAYMFAKRGFENVARIISKK